jgi:hypothetical protein
MKYVKYARDELYPFSVVKIVDGNTVSHVADSQNLISEEKAEILQKLISWRDRAIDTVDLFIERSGFVEN